MKTRTPIPLLIFALAMAAICAHSVRIAAQVGQSAVAGVWRAQMNGLPAITLNVTTETGSLNGAILFYLLRKDPGKAETSSPGIPEPLMHPQFDGKVLTFSVSHRRAHGASTATDPPVNFTMTLVGANKARLVSGHDGTAGIEIMKDAD